MTIAIAMVIVIAIFSTPCLVNNVHAHLIDKKIEIIRCDEQHIDTCKSYTLLIAI